MGPSTLLGMSVGINVGTAGTYIYDTEFVDETHETRASSTPAVTSARPTWRHHLRHNSELAFDYLRDTWRATCPVQPAAVELRDRRRGDSILIESAHASHHLGQSDESPKVLRVRRGGAARQGCRLRGRPQAQVGVAHRGGHREDGRWTGIKNIYDLETSSKPPDQPALKAKRCSIAMRSTCQDGEVIIVDEFTAAPCPDAAGRRLHQAGSERGVKVQQEQRRSRRSRFRTISGVREARRHDRNRADESEEFHKI